MKEVVTAPVLFFLTSILFGMGILFLYDMIRTVRIVFFHKGIFVILEDLGFSIFVAVTSFMFLCTYNYGELRGYFFLGIFLGMIIYRVKISFYILKAEVFLLSKVRDFIVIIGSKVTKPMISIQRNIKWRLKKERKNVTMALKSQTKRGGQSGTKKKKK